MERSLVLRMITILVFHPIEELVSVTSLLRGIRDGKHGMDMAIINTDLQYV